MSSPAGDRDGRARRWPAVGLGLAAVAAVVVLALALALRWADPDPARLDLGAAGAGAAAGTWRGTSLTTNPEDPTAPADRAARGIEDLVLDLDTTTAVLAGDAGCGPLLGSFTLDPAGGASFTVPSATPSSCPAAAARREARVRRVLEEATAWSVTGDRLILEGPAGRLVLERT